jgi:hypothetical protein
MKKGCSGLPNLSAQTCACAFVLHELRLLSIVFAIIHFSLIEKASVVSLQLTLCQAWRKEMGAYDLKSNLQN